MKHTPEPWALSETECDIMGKDNVFVMEEMYHDNDIWHNPNDMPRIVACVNACAGIEDPAKAIQAARGAIQHLLEWEPRVKGADEAEAWDEARKALQLLTPKP